MATMRFRKRVPSARSYDRMRDEILTSLDRCGAYSEDMAVREANRRVAQRREADRKAIGLPAHWPPFETPMEHTDRELRIRRDGALCRDDGDRAMFLEDVRAWQAVEPAWDAHEITIHIMDRGFYCRYGYAWGLKLAQEFSHLTQVEGAPR